MKRYVVVKQTGAKDCGVACLKAILKYWKGNIETSKLRKLTNTTKEGTTAYHLIEAAKQLGFNAKGYRGTINQLIVLNHTMPLICHIIVDDTLLHFVVVYEINKKNRTILIMDPAYGLKTMTFFEFEKVWSGIALELIPITNLPNKKETNYIKNQIKQFSLTKKSNIGTIFFLSLLTSIATILIGFSFKVILQLIEQKNLTFLVVPLVIFIILIIIKEGTDYLRTKQLVAVNKELEESLFQKLHHHIISLPYKELNNYTTGEILAYLDDLGEIRNLFSSFVLILLLDIIGAFVIIFILLKISPLLFIIACFFFIINQFLTWIFKDPMQKIIKKIRLQNGIHLNYFLETLTGIESFKNLNLETQREKTQLKIYQKLLIGLTKLSNQNNSKTRLTSLSIHLGTITILFAGGILINQKILKLGDLMTFYALYNLFLEPMQNLTNLQTTCHNAKIASNRLNEIFTLEEEKKESVEAITLNSFEFKNLYYINDRLTILDNLNWLVQEKEHIMIVGKSGSGKSTLCKILKGYESTKAATLYFNYQETEQYHLDTIKNEVRYISQNEFIITASIKENILMGRTISEELKAWIYQITKVNELIKLLPLGENTLLEENGANLSGGQRQYVILARSLVTEFSILILDETLNQVDRNTERTILKDLIKYYHTKIIIVVSHRLDNADLFDKIVELEEGKIKKILQKKKGKSK